MADKQIKDFTAQSPVEYTNKYVTQDVSNNTKYTQHSVLLGGWHGGANRWSDNAYYDGAWKYRTTGYAASLYNNSGTLEFYSNTGSAGAAISWISASISANNITAAGNISVDDWIKLTVAGADRGLVSIGSGGNVIIYSNAELVGGVAKLKTTGTSYGLSTSTTGIYSSYFNGIAGDTIAYSETTRVQYNNISIGRTRSVAGSAELGLITEVGETVYNALLQKGSGANGILKLINKGTGAFELYTNDTVLGLSQNSSGSVLSNVTTDSSSTSTGSLIVSGGVGIAKKLYVGTDSHTAGVLYGDSITDSTSSTTGGCIISGGVGIAKNIYSTGTGITLDNAVNPSITIKTTDASTGLTVYQGTSGIVWRVGKINTSNNFVIQRYIAGVLQDTPFIIGNSTGALGISGTISHTNTTDSSSTITGAGIFAGGIGIAKKLYVGTDTHVGGVLYGESTTDSTSTTTGGCIFSGGVGIAKKLYVGTSIICSSSSATVITGSSSSTNGKGVYGTVSGSDGWGVYGISTHATAGIGVYGEGALKGVSGYGTGASGIGVQGIGVFHDFYAAGTGTYGPFTGSHDVRLEKNIYVQGMIVSTVGEVVKRKDSISTTFPKVNLANTDNDSKIFGVFNKYQEKAPEWYDNKKDQFASVNALGEGCILVTDINGELQVGDLITSTVIPGYGGKQSDDIVHNYTVGKITEIIEWSKIKDTVEYKGKKYKKYLAACVYYSA